MKKNNVGYLFVLPAVIGFSIFILLPMVFSLVISFTDFNIFKGISGTVFLGLDNYIRLIHDPIFWKSLFNNIIFIVVTVPIQIILALIVAYFLNDKLYGCKFFRVFSFLPYVSNIVAVSFIWMALFNPSQGVINQVLMHLGISNPPGWLTSFHSALPAVMIVSIWISLGYNVLVYIAGMQNIDSTMYEASEIDGANSFQKFMKITIPSLSSTTFFLTVTGIISSFKVFGQINIMTQGGPGNSTNVLAYYIYQNSFSYYDMGYAAAMAWVLMFIMIIVTVIQFRKEKGGA